MHKKLLQELAALLESYNPVVLISSIAGLQLVPENAERSLRLEVLAYAAATLPFESGRKPQITANKLGQICNGELIKKSGVPEAEDPFDNPFTEEMIFYGGSYIVFPGIVEESPFVLRHLAKSIFLAPEPFPNREFVAESHGLLWATLRLSHAIATRTGLERGMEPKSGPGRNVTIPDAQRLTFLKQAVSFSRGELLELLAEHQIPFAILEPLITELGSISVDQYDLDNHRLWIAPLVHSKDRYIVSIPSALLAAARNRIIQLAIAHGVVDVLARRYAAACWDTVRKSLSYTRNSPVPIPLPSPPEIPCGHDGFFSLDSDKLIYAVLAGDPLAQYDPLKPFGERPESNLSDQIDERIRSIETYAYCLPHSPNALLFLALPQGVGRRGALGFGKILESDTSHFLAMSVADLETTCLLEGGNPLALWKFAKASDEVRKRTHIVSFGHLDEYNAYRKSNYSYYVSDEFMPDSVAIAPGGAGEIRREVLSQRDWHAAVSPDADGFVEVTALHSTRAIPIYSPMPEPGKQIAILVTGLPVPVWIAENPPGEKHYQFLRGLYLEFADAIAYWLWQVSPSLKSILEPVKGNQTRLLVRLSLQPDERWKSGGVKREELDEAVDEAVAKEVNVEEGVLDLILHPSIASIVEGPDNEGERLLIKRILEGLREILPTESYHVLSDRAIQEIIDKYAPLGIKKKLLILNVGAAPQLDETGIPNYRKIQEADVNFLLDELRHHLSSTLGLMPGPIADDKRTELLEGVVGFFYQELEKLIMSLRHEGLPDFLIAHHESIVHQDALRALTVPTRLACFSTPPEMVEHLKKEIPEVSQAALASRFIIEYVSARPPEGFRPMSLSVYDRLQALAYHVVSFGMLRDQIRSSLADIKLEILGSGRLGVDYALFADALESYLPVFAAGHITRLTKAFSRYWSKPNSEDERPDLVRRVDAATAVEFGYSLTELLELMQHIGSIGSELDPVVPCIEFGELVNRLRDQIGWSPERISSALKFLGLQQRSDFLEPPPPFKKAEVYPWRFNRAFSYLRRPLILWEKEGKIMTVWGPRHLHTTMNYLINSCVGGRSRAQTPEMRKLQGELHQQQGQDFNNRVAEIYEVDSSLLVRRRVKKIRTDEGAIRPPGDIDILVADPRKRQIKVVECKDLALARTPEEMANELVTLVQGSASRKPVAEKHLERTKWVRGHQRAILRWLGLPVKGRWKVEPLIVVDHELFSPFLHVCPVRVVSVAQLERELK